MKRLYILAAIAILCQTAFSQKKYEMVVEKTDGTETVINVEDIVRTYFREKGNENNPDDNTPGEATLVAGEYTIHANHAYWGYSTKYHYHVLYFMSADFFDIVDLDRKTITLPQRMSMIEVDLVNDLQTSSVPEGDFLFDMTAYDLDYSKSDSGTTDGIYFEHDRKLGNNNTLSITRVGDNYTIKGQNLKVYGGRYAMTNYSEPNIEDKVYTTVSFTYTGPITTLSESFMNFVYD